MNGGIPQQPMQPQQTQYQQPLQPQYGQQFVQYGQHMQQVIKSAVMKPMTAVDRKAKRMGIASLILGIIGIVFCWILVISLITGIIGIVLSVKARNSIPVGAPGRGIATAGLVLSIIGIVLGVIFIFYFAYACYHLPEIDVDDPDLYHHHFFDDD